MDKKLNGQVDEWVDRHTIIPLNNDYIVHIL